MNDFDVVGSTFRDFDSLVPGSLMGRQIRPWMNSWNCSFMMSSSSPGPIPIKTLTNGGNVIWRFGTIRIKALMGKKTPIKRFIFEKIMIHAWQPTKDRNSRGFYGAWRLHYILREVTPMKTQRWNMCNSHLINTIIIEANMMIGKGNHPRLMRNENEHYNSGLGKLVHTTSSGRGYFLSWNQIGRSSTRSLGVGISRSPLHWMATVHARVSFSR